MKIKNKIIGLLAAVSVMNFSFAASAENYTMSAKVPQPDEICGYVNLNPSTDAEVYVKIIKYTPETTVNDEGYEVYDSVINGEKYHSSDVLVFPLEYNNFNFETKAYEGSYDVIIGVNKYIGSEKTEDIVYKTIKLVVKDYNYCNFNTSCNVNIEITDEELTEPECVESGSDSDKTYNLKFSVTEPKEEYIPGDANNDGVVNIRDAALIALKISKSQLEDLTESADYNQDGTVNVRDAAAIAKFLSNR